MDFLDKKTRVYELKLTPHGKRKLANGTFDPEYFTCHDENIVYDSSVDDFYSEIFDKNISLSPQVHYGSAEQGLLLDDEMSEKEGDYYSKISKNPLGHSSSTSDSTVLSFQIYGQSQIESVSKEDNIYNITLSDNITEVRKIISDTSNGFQDGTVDDASSFDIEDNKDSYFMFNDDSYIEVTHGEVLLDIGETNIDLNDLSFSLEIYEVINNNGEEELRLMKFSEETQRIVDDLMVISSNVDLNYRPGVADEYFDINFDMRVDDRVYCRYGISSINYNRYTKYEIDCSKLRQIESFGREILGPIGSECD